MSVLILPWTIKSLTCAAAWGFLLSVCLLPLLIVSSRTHITSNIGWSSTPETERKAKEKNFPSQTLLVWECFAFSKKINFTSKLTCNSCHVCYLTIFYTLSFDIPEQYIVPHLHVSPPCLPILHSVVFKEGDGASLYPHLPKQHPKYNSLLNEVVMFLYLTDLFGGGHCLQRTETQFFLKRKREVIVGLPDNWNQKITGFQEFWDTALFLSASKSPSWPISSFLHNCSFSLWSSPFTLSRLSSNEQSSSTGPHLLCTQPHGWMRGRDRDTLGQMHTLI